MLFGNELKFEVIWSKLNPSLDNKILALSKVNAFANNKINVTQKIKFVFHVLENTVGNGENAGYQHFLLFP